MNRFCWNTIVCFALLVAVTGPQARPQNVGAQAKIAPQDPAAAIDLLKKQLAALEYRVKQLEKQQLDQLKSDDVDEARAKKMEERLATVEKAAENPKPDSSSNSNTKTSGQQTGQTVRAPFAVVDESGKTIFRVDLTSTNRARAVVGDPSGAHVHMGTNSAGGATVIAAYGPGDDQAGAYLVSSPGSSAVVARNAKRMARLDADAIGGAVRVLNSSDVPVAVMDSGKLGRGGLFLSDAEGTSRVQAGTTGESVGEVRTSGPGGGGLATAPGVAPSIIRGWLKKKSSE